MPKKPQLHASERIDKVDLDQFLDFAQEADEQHRKLFLSDLQSRILRGFRVELPDQSTFPGRVVVHGGVAVNYDGKILFDETQINISRTITLEGANTNFYLEVEFLESDSDLDARAFWDPTVDQGLDVSGDALPDGQEFSNNVSTRKSLGWRIVQPVSTTGFARDQVSTINSTRVPLVQLRTNGSNEVDATENTNLVTEKASTTLVEEISTTQIRVKNASLLRVGDDISLTDSSGSEAATIAAINYETNLLTISAIAGRAAGAVVRVTSLTSPDFLTESGIGRYQRIATVASPPNHVIDHRDHMFKGDEVHGEILSRGHASAADRDDVNLESLKDYVDFLSAQIQEMKWGSLSPYTDGDDTSRVPPGVSASLLPTPRYYDRAGGIQGARYPTVSVGDGLGSFGDFNGNDHTALEAALGVLTGTGGTLFIKRGTYNISLVDLDIVITNAAVELTVMGEPGTILTCSAGNQIVIDCQGTLELRELTITGTATTTTPLSIQTNNPANFRMRRVRVSDGQVSIAAVLPVSSVFDRCEFEATSAFMAAIPLMTVTASGSLNGYFEGCELLHVSAAANPGACLDMSTAGAYTVFLSMKDCFFYANDAGLLTGALIDLGNSASNILIESSKFQCVTALWHVVCSGGSSQRYVRNLQLDDVAGMFGLSGVSDLLISENINGNTGYSAVAVESCPRTVIARNTFTNNGTLQLTGSAIRVNVSADANDLTIESNHIKGDTTNEATTGVIIDFKGAFDLVGTKILNNKFEHLECGIYFFQSGAGSFAVNNVDIRGNEFFDPESTKTAKMGIATGTGGQCTNWQITDNMFSDLSDTGSLLGQGAGEALYMQMFSVSIAVERNTITSCGVAGAGCAPIDFAGAAPNNAIVANNVFRLIGGTSVFVIRLGTTTNAVNAVVSNNSVNGASGTTGVYFLKAYGLTKSNVSGNNVELSLVGGSSGAGILIDGASGSCYDSSVSGNVFIGSNTGGTNLNGIQMTGLDEISNLALRGNVIQGGSSSGGGFTHGIRLTTSAAGDIQSRINISDNTIEANEAAAYGIWLDNAASTLTNLRGLVVRGNQIVLHSQSGVGAAIDAGHAPQAVISENNIEFYNSGGDPVGITVGSTAIFTVVQSNTSYRGSTVTAAHILFDSANLNFTVIGNLCAEQLSTNTADAIDLSVCTGAHFVGFNFVDLSADEAMGAGRRTVTLASASGDGSIKYTTP